VNTIRQIKFSGVLRLAFGQHASAIRQEKVIAKFTQNNQYSVVGDGVIDHGRDVEEPNDGHCDDQLGRQNSIVFPDEASPDGGLGEDSRAGYEDSFFSLGHFD
jgi:hypothetical protein